MESSPLRILALGDSYLPSPYFRAAFTELDAAHVIDYADVATVRAPATPTPSEAKLREYLGSPARLIARMVSVDVLAVHGPKVTLALNRRSLELAEAGLGRPPWRAPGT